MNVTVELPKHLTEELAAVMGARYRGVAFHVWAWTPVAHVAWMKDYAAIVVGPTGSEPAIIVLGEGRPSADQEKMLRDKINEYWALIESTEKLLQRFALAQFGYQTDELAAQFPDPPAPRRLQPRKIVGRRIIRRDGESDAEYLDAAARHLETIRIGRAHLLRIAMSRAIESITSGDDVDLSDLVPVVDHLLRLLSDAEFLENR